MSEKKIEEAHEKLNQNMIVFGNVFYKVVTAIAITWFSYVLTEIYL